MELRSRNTRALIHITNVVAHLRSGGVITRERIYDAEKWKSYRLLNDVHVILSNGELIHIPAGFEWDLSSVPRLFWAILPPDGDFEIAALIHDYLYQKKLFTRRFADKEMLVFSNATNRSKVDNYIRFYAVRLFGWSVWNKKKKPTT
jgi:hypothetical protein